MSDKRPFIHRIELPLQATGEETKVTLPWPVCWLTISDGTGIAKGFQVSNCSDAAKFGHYYFTDAQRMFKGPWYGLDVFLRSQTAGAISLNLVAFPLEWFTGGRL